MSCSTHSHTTLTVERTKCRGRVSQGGVCLHYCLVFSISDLTASRSLSLSAKLGHQPLQLFNRIDIASGWWGRLP